MLHGVYYLPWGAPSGTVWWKPCGSALFAINALYGAAWLFLGKALLDGGLGL